MRAASPLAFSNMPPAQPNPFRSVGTSGSQLTAAGELARAIDLAKTAVDGTRRVVGSAGHATCQSDGRPLAPCRPRRGSGGARHLATSSRSQMTASQAQALVGDVAALTQAHRRTRPALQEHPRMGAAGAERAARLGGPRGCTRRQPRATRLRRRPPRLAPEDEDHPGPGQARDPRCSAGAAQPRDPDEVGPQRDEPPTGRGFAAARVRPPGAVRGADRRAARRAMDRARRDLLRHPAGTPRGRRTARQGRPGRCRGLQRRGATAFHSRRTRSSNHASFPASSCSSTGSTTASPTSSKTGSSVAPSSSASRSPALSTEAGNSSARSANASCPSPLRPTLPSYALSASGCDPGSRCRQPPRGRRESTCTPP